MVVPIGLNYSYYLPSNYRKGVHHMNRRKELKLAYKLATRAMGVYQIKNNKNGKIFIGSSMNLPGSLNGSRFKLDAKAHNNKVLQEDWNLYGCTAFTFDILETLKSGEIIEEDWREAIAVMEDNWLATLKPYNEKGYNKLKKI